MFGFGKMEWLQDHLLPVINMSNMAIYVLFPEISGRQNLLKTI